MASQRCSLPPAVAAALEQLHVVGREAQPALVLLHRAVVLDRVDAAVEVAGGEVDQRIVGPERARPLERRPRRIGQRLVGHAVGVERGAGSRELAPRLREGRVERHRALEEADRPPQAGLVGLHLLRGRFALQVLVVRRQVLGRLRRQLAPGAVAQHHAERVGHLAGDVRLDGEHVGERGVDRLLPARRRRRAAGEADQLGIHPHPAHPLRPPLPSDLPDQEVVHAQLPGDLRQPPRAAAIVVRAEAGDHLQPGHRGQLAADLVGHAVGEIRVGRVAEVLEREHGEAA